MATSVSNSVETINSTQSLILIKNMSALSLLQELIHLFPPDPSLTHTHYVPSPWIGFDYQFHLSVIYEESFHQIASQVLSITQTL
jgi:hypothetical protein